MRKLALEITFMMNAMTEGDRELRRGITLGEV
jgi:hypothetical protein